MKITGCPRVDIFERSLQTLIARHESLRTTFLLQGGDPVQVIAPARDLPFPLVDLGSLPDSEREALAQRLAAESASTAFDLEKGPLVRVSLLKLTRDEYVLLLNMHHIISDGWSMGVFIREMILAYQAFPPRGGAAFSRFTDSIPGLRGLAARVATGRGSGSPFKFLEKPPRGTASHP